MIFQVDRIPVAVQRRPAEQCLPSYDPALDPALDLTGVRTSEQRERPQAMPTPGNC